MKRILSIALSLLMLVCTVPAFTVSAAAATTVSVSTGNELRKYLQRSGDYNIKITKNISYRVDGAKYTCFATLGKGNKILDLNGKTVTIANDYYSTTAFEQYMLFTIGSDASLTVNDSAGGATVKSDGTLHDYGFSTYKKANRSVRDIFFVSGGSLTINGGSFEAGRSKKAYNSVAVRSEYHQINGSAIIATNAATVVINGGSFYGRGWRGNYLRCAAISQRDEKSKVTINNAHVYGKGGADTFDLKNAGNVYIYSGTYTNEVQDYTVDVFAYFEKSGNTQKVTAKGSLGMYNRMVAPMRKVTGDGEEMDLSRWKYDLQKCSKKVVVAPNKSEVILTLPAAVGGYYVSRYGTSGRVFRANNYVNRFDDVTANDSAVHTVTYTWKVYPDGKPGQPLTMRNGKTYATTTGKTFDIYQQLDCSTLTDGAAYQLRVEVTETYKGADAYTLTVSDTTSFYATNEVVPVITNVTKQAVAGKKGDTVTLQATVTGLTEANKNNVIWLKKENGYAYSLGKSTSVNGNVYQLEVPVQEACLIYCSASTKVGQAKGSDVEVSYCPAFTGTAQTIAVQQSDSIFLSMPHDGENSGRLTPNAAATGWYRINSSTGQEERVDGSSAVAALKGRTVASGDSLTISNAVKADAGTYYRKLVYQDANGTTKTITSPQLTVTVSNKDSLITSFIIDGFEQPVYGEVPTQKEDLTAGSDRYTIESVSWSGVHYTEKVINSTNASVTVKLKATGDNQFWFNDSGNISGTLGAYTVTAYGTAGTGTDTISVTKDYNPYSSYRIYQPYDTFLLQEDTFSVMAGTAVDFKVGISVNCDAQHSTKHTKACNVKVNSGALPEGLSIDADGRITGTTSIPGTYTVNLWIDNGDEKDYNRSNGVVGPITIEVTEHKHTYETDESTNTATCNKAGTAKARCIYADYCGAAEKTVATPATGTHMYNSAVKLDSTYHNAVCADCAKKVKEKHQWVVDESQDATLKKNGYIRYICNTCGATKKTTVYYPKTFKLAKTAYVYTGKVIKPAVTVTNSNGAKIAASNYTVKYSNNKKVGTATVTVTFKDSSNYTGTKKLTFKINPKATSISKLTAGKNSMTVQWKKQAEETPYYQIQYSTDKNFKKNVTTVNVKKNATVKKTLKKLTSKKTYYVRIRTYKVVNQKTYYSAWSKAKYVKVK